MPQKREYYSHSSIQTYLTCPLQFKYRYFDKLPAKTSIEAFVGSAVHKILEIFYKIHQLKGVYLPLTKLLEYYKSFWKKKFKKEEVFIIRKSMKITDYYVLGKQCISYYYNTYFTKNHLIERTINVEQEINVEFNGIKFKGFIDRLVLKKNNIIEIHDYKTGKYIPSKKDQTFDTQLALYQLAIQKKYPNKKIVLIWYYLQLKKKIEIMRSEPELVKLREFLLKVIREIESKEEFKPKKNHLCGWCSYKEICPLFQFKPGIKKFTL